MHNHKHSQKLNFPQNDWRSIFFIYLLRWLQVCTGRDCMQEQEMKWPNRSFGEWKCDYAGVLECCCLHVERDVTHTKNALVVDGDWQVWFFCVCCDFMTRVWTHSRTILCVVWNVVWNVVVICDSGYLFHSKFQLHVLALALALAAFVWVQSTYEWLIGWNLLCLRTVTSLVRITVHDSVEYCGIHGSFFSLRLRICTLNSILFASNWISPSFNTHAQSHSIRFESNRISKLILSMICATS